MLKKILLTLLLSIASITAQPISGSGTANDPYVIYQADQLDSIAYLYPYIALGNDIDLQGATRGPIPQLQNSGEGRYIDGRFHKIYNGTIIGGLFDTDVYYIITYYPIKIKNIRFENLQLNEPIFRRWDSRGLSNSEYSMENVIAKKCTLTATTTVVPPHGWGIIGGLVNSGPRVRNIGVDSCAIYIPNIDGNTAESSIAFVFAGYSDTPLQATNIFAKNSTIIVSNTGTFYRNVVHLGSIYGFKTVHYLNNFYCLNNTIRVCVMPATNYNWSAQISSIIGGIEYELEPATDSITRGYIQIDTLSWVPQTYTAAAIIHATSRHANDTAAFYSNKLRYLVYIDSAGFVTDTTMYKYIGSNIGPVYHNYPTIATPSDARQTSTYQNWDFVNTWGISPGINKGFPYLQFEVQGDIVIYQPDGTQNYTGQDTILIQWSNNSTDSVKIYYSSNNGYSWNFITKQPFTTTNYAWIHNLPNGSYKIKIENALYPALYNESNIFNIYTTPYININTPNNFNINYTYGDSLAISIEVANIQKLHLFYRTNLNNNWKSIFTNRAINHDMETITYYWHLPLNLADTVYLKASNLLDSNQTNLLRDIQFIGVNRESYPQICWYATSYEDKYRSLISFNREVDQTCGWGYNQQFKHHAKINNDGTGFIFTQAPLSINGPLSLGNYYALNINNDTIVTPLEDIYLWTNDRDTLIYNQRAYFIADSSLYAKDILNNIDSIKVCNLGPFMRKYSINGTPSYMVIYDKQYENIKNQYIPLSTPLTSFNSNDFVPKILIGGWPTTGYSWIVAGQITLPEDPEQGYIEDTTLALIIDGVNRDLFRGIHPKAEKR